MLVLRTSRACIISGLRTVRELDLSQIKGLYLCVIFKGNCTLLYTRLKELSHGILNCFNYDRKTPKDNNNNKP